MKTKASRGLIKIMHVNEGHYVGTGEHSGNQGDEESNDVEYIDADNVHSEEIGIEGGHNGISNSDGRPSNAC
jgi:hypothetical protein